MGENSKSVMDLASQYNEASTAMAEHLAPEFARFGLSLDNFRVNAITPPEDVQRAIDERSRMKAIGNMGDYTRMDVNEQYVGIAPTERAVGRPAILFQKVPERKVVKNRVHLDLRGETMAGEVERLLALGATFIAERSLGESVRWTVMADPEGNEFCVSGDA